MNAKSAASDSSLWMKAFRAIGRDDLAWALRRLYVPVPDSALVLEVGSGGNPFPRANVLLDAYRSTRERHYQPLITDRPLVLGRIEEMPFRDNAFDFVIACHVIEHSDNIEACLSELQRVARAGYIECPDAFLERINPYRDHRIELTVRDGVLKIKEKAQWIDSADVVELYEAKLKQKQSWKRFLQTNPFDFHSRLFWSRDAGGIQYSIDRVATSESAWQGSGESVGIPSESLGSRVRVALRDSVRRMLSQKSRNDSLDLVALLRCPQCRRENLRKQDASILCCDCGASYQINGSTVSVGS